MIPSFVSVAKYKHRTHRRRMSPSSDSLWHICTEPRGSRCRRMAESPQHPITTYTNLPPAYGEEEDLLPSSRLGWGSITSMGRPQVSLSYARLVQQTHVQPLKMLSSACLMRLTGRLTPASFDRFLKLEQSGHGTEIL